MLLVEWYGCGEVHIGEDDAVLVGKGVGGGGVRLRSRDKVSDGVRV